MFVRSGVGVASGGSIKGCGVVERFIRSRGIQKIFYFILSHMCHVTRKLVKQGKTHLLVSYID